MSDKRFKIGDRVKVVSISKNAPADTIGLTGKTIRKSDSNRFDWCVSFENFRKTGHTDWFTYNDCDLEPAEAVIPEPAKPATVKLEIEIPAIPKDKIPAGMKLGTPAYEKRIVKDDDMVLTVEMEWENADGLVGRFGIVANFVPIEPVEEPSIDREVTTSAHAVLYQIKAPDDFANWRLTDIACHIQFVEYLWKDADGRIIYRTPYFFRHAKFGVCTHVRFSNPKFKQGE